MENGFEMINVEKGAKELDPAFREQLSLLDPVECWIDDLHAVYGRGVAPKYFHMAIKEESTMPEVISQAADLIYREGLKEWERLVKKLKRQDIFTAFDREISKIVATAVNEQRGLAAFVLQTYQPIPRAAVPMRAGIYGVRKTDVENTVRGQLFYYGVPPYRETSSDFKIFDFSNESIEGSILKLTIMNGNGKHRCGFDLAGI